MFMYVVADQTDAKVSPVQIVMAPDLHTAKIKLLDELQIQEIDLWIMEFTKN